MDKESKYSPANIFLYGPIFLVGLLARLILIAVFVPEIHIDWFIPFLEHGIRSLSIDPWSAWLNASGDALAYPYGPVMYILHIPGSILGLVLGYFLDIDRSFGLGLGTNLLLVDIALLWILQYYNSGSVKKILIYYWISPIVLYVTYWNGQTDLIPTCLLVLSLFLLKVQKVRKSAVLFGLAVSTKLSVLLAAPFIFLYILNNKRYQTYFFTYAMYFFGTILLILGPFMFSEGFRLMVLGTPEVEKIYSLFIQHRSVVSDIRPLLKLYITPMIYLLVVYWAWRVGRMSYDLLFSLCGIGFFVILLLTPASPGWFLWVVPFLVIHQLNSDIKSRILIISFSILFILINLLLSNGAILSPFFGKIQDGINLAGNWHTDNLKYASLLYTLMEAIGIIIMIRLYRLGVAENDFYMLGKKPIILGIAGSTSVGKNILSKSFMKIFGMGSTSMISLDTYKKWDQDTPMERVSAISGIPRSYNLNKFAQAVLAQATLARENYYSEKKINTIKHIFSVKDLVIAEGPFVLLIPALQNRLTVKIFIEMDQNYHRFYELKMNPISEEMTNRLTDELIEIREQKYSIYGKQQYELADIYFKLIAKEKVQHEESCNLEDINFRLKVLLRRSINIDYLVKVLITDCNMDVDVRFMEKASEVEMIIDGYLIEGQVQILAKKLVPHLEELLDLHSKLDRGVIGLMQLIILNYLGEKYYSIKKQN